MFPFNDSYIKKVRGVRPQNLVSLWPQNEPLGHGVSTEVIRGYNGVYTAVTLGQPGLQGSWMTSAGYDGATSFNNVLSADLVAAFNGAAGTLLAYPRIANVGVWTDAATRMAAYFYVDGNNYVSIARNTANNRMDLYYKAGGVAEASNIVGLTTTGFMPLGQTWDVDAGVDGEQKIYLGGVQQGVTATALGVWVGNLARAVVGASSIVPATVWSGSVGPVALWNKALTPDEMRYLGT